jgi:hypothetical protein
LNTFTRLDNQGNRTCRAELVRLLLGHFEYVSWNKRCILLVQVMVDWSCVARSMGSWELGATGYKGC